MTSRTYATDDVRIAVETHDPPVTQPGYPLLVALHGGSYTGRYFAVAGAPAGSFVAVAARTAAVSHCRTPATRSPGTPNLSTNSCGGWPTRLAPHRPWS
jgi:hypothetical protein